MKDYFYKPIKIQDKEDNIFFWSDLHLGHACTSWDVPLYVKRGFKTLEEHDSTLIKRWNEKIKIESTVFNLGDMLFGNNGLERLKGILEILNFKKMFLLFGNHMAGTKQLFESINENIYEVNSEKTVIFCPNYLESYINGYPCVLSHYAIASFNGQSKGSYMIHGHSHGSLANSDFGKMLYKARILDVGVENCSYPISFREIRNKFKKDPISFDHHTKQTSNPFC
jgi:calcineurin-like phosphoesterase family protein